MTRTVLTFATITRTPVEAAEALTAGCLPCELAALAEADAEVEAAAPSTVTWSGVIGVEEELTGDGRMIAANALRWATLPIPLRWVDEDQSMGHAGAVVVGRITEMERQSGGLIFARGDFDMGTDSGAEAARRVEAGTQQGISMDLDEVSFEVRVARELIEREEELDAADEANEVPAGEVDADGRITVITVAADDEIMVTTDARIRAATIVAIPAFEPARITLDGALDALVASVVGATDLPVADRGMGWDGPSAASRVFDFYTDGDTVDTTAVARAFLWRDDDANPETQAAYSLGFADIVDGELRIVPRGVAACAGGRGVGAVSGLSDEDRSRIEARICTLYDRVRNVHDDWPECPFDTGSNALAASAFPVAPPAVWFSDPQLTEPTRITITPDGRIYGHVAIWGTCHTAYPGQCVTPPPSPSNYARFRTGTVLTSEGTEVPTGRITMDTLHAGRSLSAAETLSHYENTGRAIADVAAGEDAHGIWVAGAMRPNATPEQVRALRASPLSGDWRDYAGALDMVAALAVNVPGFPIPRPQGLVASGRMQSLVAAGMVPPSLIRLPGTTGALSSDDLHYLKRLADRERRDQQTTDDAAAVLARRARAASFARRVAAIRSA